MLEIMFSRLLSVNHFEQSWLLQVFVKIMYFNLGLGIIKYQHLSQFLSVSAILKSVVDNKLVFWISLWVTKIFQRNSKELVYAVASTRNWFSLVGWWLHLLQAWFEIVQLMRDSIYIHIQIIKIEMYADSRNAKGPVIFWLEL